MTNDELIDKIALALEQRVGVSKWQLTELLGEANALKDAAEMVRGMK